MNRLKELREEAMITVRELSDRSGVSSDTITKIENGHRRGRGVTLRKIANALGIRPDQLIKEQPGETIREEHGTRGARGRDEPFGHEAVSSPDTGNANANAASDDLKAAIALVYETEAPTSSPGAYEEPTRRLSDALRQALLNQLKEGGLEPSEFAERIGTSVSTAYHKLRVLEQEGLVEADESGKRFISDEGRTFLYFTAEGREKQQDLDEYLLKHLDLDEYLLRAEPSRVDDALRRIDAVIGIYKSVVGSEASGESKAADPAAFRRLQMEVIRSIRRIALAADPPASSLAEKLVSLHGSARKSKDRDPVGTAHQSPGY